MAGRERERRLQIGILVAAMVLLIQDIDRPGAGFIKVGQQPMANGRRRLLPFPTDRTHRLRAVPPEQEMIKAPVAMSREPKKAR